MNVTLILTPLKQHVYVYCLQAVLHIAESMYGILQ
jgi:hypothetical protein